MLRESHPEMSTEMPRPDPQRLGDRQPDLPPHDLHELVLGIRELDADQATRTRSACRPTPPHATLVRGHVTPRSHQTGLSRRGVSQKAQGPRVPIVDQNPTRNCFKSNIAW